MAIGTSVTIVEERHGSVKRVQFTWVTASASSGGVTATTSYAYNGSVLRLVTIPGTSAPSASYSVAMSDQDSTDILIGAGASRHSANTQQVIAVSLGVIANDTITFNVTSAGSSTSGAAIVYIR